MPDAAVGIRVHGNPSCRAGRPGTGIRRACQCLNPLENQRGEKHESSAVLMSFARFLIAAAAHSAGSSPYCFM
jgi:hypothetical protein